MALLYRLDEPLCRIQLLLHESCRFLLFTLRRVCRIHEKVGIFPVYAQLRNREAWHAEQKFAILVFKEEVRDDLLGLIRI